MDERTVRVGVQGAKILSKLFNKYDPAEVLKRCPLPECKGRSVGGVVVEESSPKVEAGYPRQRSEETVIDLPALTQLIGGSGGPARALPASNPPAQRSMPTTAETIAVVKQDIIDQCDQLGFDLTRGGRIAGVGCDCLVKHSGNIIALCREIVTMDPNPAYTQLEQWLTSMLPYFQHEYIDGKVVRDEDANSPTHGQMIPDLLFYRNMLPTLRGYRKQIQGTAA